MSWIHSFPGAVRTDIGDGLPFPLGYILAFVTSLIGVTSAQCAARQTPLFDEKYRVGVWRTDERGNALTLKIPEDSEGAGKRVWDHIDEVTQR